VLGTPNNKISFDPTNVPGYSNYLRISLPPSHESVSSNISSLGPWEGGRERLLSLIKV
jgi:hypothetical protein